MCAGAPRFTECDCHSLFTALYLFAATRFELTFLIFVHHFADFAAAFAGTGTFLRSHIVKTEYQYFVLFSRVTVKLMLHFAVTGSSLLLLFIDLGPGGVGAVG
jgi:hypothetical protein